MYSGGWGGRFARPSSLAMAGEWRLRHGFDGYRSTTGGQVMVLPAHPLPVPVPALGDTGLNLRFNRV
jgi:hypothetical protein